MKPEEIVLMRYNDRAWGELVTTFDQRVGDTFRFTAATPGLSYFAIATRLPPDTGNATAAESTPVITSATAGTVPVQSGTPNAGSPVPSAAGKPVAAGTTAVPVSRAGSGNPPGSMVPLAIAVIAGAAVGGLLVRRWWIRRQNPALFRDYD